MSSNSFPELPKEFTNTYNTIRIGSIIGGSVGAAVLIGIVVGAVFFVRRRNRRHREQMGFNEKALAARQAQNHAPSWQYGRVQGMGRRKSDAGGGAAAAAEMEHAQGQQGVVGGGGAEEVDAVGLQIHEVQAAGVHEVRTGYLHELPVTLDGRARRL